MKRPPHVAVTGGRAAGYRKHRNPAEEHTVKNPMQQPLKNIQFLYGEDNDGSIPSSPPGDRDAIRWSGEWQPPIKRQRASALYTARWGSEGSGHDAVVDRFHAYANLASGGVGKSPARDAPILGPEILVATSLDNTSCRGGQGVVWEAIYESLQRRAHDDDPVNHLVLESGIELLASPTICPGRDFAVLLSTLKNVGYAAEWRVIADADYGLAPRPARIFLVAYYYDVPKYDEILKVAATRPSEWLLRRGPLAQAFPATGRVLRFRDDVLGVYEDPLEMQTQYRRRDDMTSPFANAGLMIGGLVWSFDVHALPLANGETLAAAGHRPVPTLGDRVDSPP